MYFCQFFHSEIICGLSFEVLCCFKEFCMFSTKLFMSVNDIADTCLFVADMNDEKFSRNFYPSVLLVN